MISTLTLAAALFVGALDEEGQGRPFLHQLFTDHVVLQRDQPIPVWGWTEPGQRVKVAMAGQSVETTADDKGKWLARLGPYPAGGPHVLTVNGPKSAEIKDILVGDVWLCSGQSNMEWHLNQVDRAAQEVAAADHPRIRLFQVPKRTAFEPTTTIDSSWKVCTPTTAAGFSAVGYLFGRDLQRELDVPIGLIDSSWGGTVAEAWASAGALEAMPDFRKSLVALKEQQAEEARGPATFNERMAAWWKKNDPGSAELPPWSSPDAVTTGWKTMDLPGHWEQKGMPDFDGIVWFRKEFNAPEAWDGKEAVLHLGPIDDRDTTFLNGVEVGHMNTYNATRNYKVASGVIKTGRNVLAVRVLDTSGQGGFAGKSDEMFLELTGEDKDKDKPEPIKLAGEWTYHETTPINEVTTPPEQSGSNPNRVSVLYNGMIAPLLPFPIKGAIWYQGESNAARPAQYRTLLPTMIKDWRDHFPVGDFPFLIVQLANYMNRRDEPATSQWAELREAQFLTTRALPNVGIGLAIDIGDARDIHPRNKQEVARRLALNALATTYGKDVEFSGPVYKAMESKGNAIKLTFDHLGGGLVAKGNDGKLEGFAIAGDDGKFVWAEAVIEGDAIVVSSPKVDKPINVRYAWSDNPACNLYNQAGLPTVPFRTDPPK